MRITLEEVETVAKLARLTVTEEEKQMFAQQLDNILTYVEKLKELDTSQVEPTSHVLPLKNVFREDEVRPSTPKEDIMSLAPERTDGFFRVPKIIE